VEHSTSITRHIREKNRLSANSPQEKPQKPPSTHYLGDQKKQATPAEKSRTEGTAPPKGRGFFFFEGNRKKTIPTPRSETPFSPHPPFCGVASPAKGDGPGSPPPNTKPCGVVPKKNVAPRKAGPGPPGRGRTPFTRLMTSQKDCASSKTDDSAFPVFGEKPTFRPKPFSPSAPPHPADVIPKA